MCSLKLITYRNTIIIVIIDYLYCYYNWWQLASENPYGYSMCCLRTYCVSFSSIFYLYTESVYFILLCNMSNKILPHHTIPLLANKIPTSTINPLSYVKNDPNSIVIEEVSEREVSDIIKSPSNSSAGWDGFPISIAKQCSKNFVKPLKALINSSIREGVFPCELKKARVVPIFKTGDNSLINNYRPISILSFYLKVFEKLMYNKLYNFIEANDILYAHQYGFRRGHSTQQAIITLINKITKSLNSDDFVISVFIDLNKAFDRVPTNILLAKLQAYGIRGDYIKWF